MTLLASTENLLNKQNYSTKIISNSDDTKSWKILFWSINDKTGNLFFNESGTEMLNLVNC